MIHSINELHRLHSQEQLVLSASCLYPSGSARLEACSNLGGHVEDHARRESLFWDPLLSQLFCNCVRSCHTSLTPALLSLCSDTLAYHASRLHFRLCFRFARYVSTSNWLRVITTLYTLLLYYLILSCSVSLLFCAATCELKVTATWSSTLSVQAVSYLSMILTRFEL